MSAIISKQGHDVRFSNRPFGSSTFRLSTSSSAMSPTGSRFSSDSAQGPSNMGFEDEVEQSFGRPRRQYDGRSKRTNDLTSSIVPWGTSFHRWVELAVSMTAGPSGQTISPHPSSREGHHSTAGWSSPSV